jgi:hypothetical protein
MPGPEMIVASVPSDDAFDDERGVTKAGQCVIQVRRAAREGKTVEWSGCVPAFDRLLTADRAAGVARS